MSRTKIVITTMFVAILAIGGFSYLTYSGQIVSNPASTALISVTRPYPALTGPKTVSLSCDYHGKNLSVSETLYTSLDQYYRDDPTKKIDYLHNDNKDFVFAYEKDDTITKLTNDIRQVAVSNDLDADQTLDIAGFTEEELQKAADQLPAGRADEARDVLGGAVSADPDAETPGIDDPAALEAAEKAAYEYREPDPSQREREDWVEILSQTPFQKHRFKAIDAALTAEGIDHTWEPYPPDQAPLVRIDFFDTERFSVSVPGSLADAGAAVIRQADDEDPDHQSPDAGDHPY